MRAAIGLNLSEYVKRFFALLMLCSVQHIDFNSNKIVYTCARFNNNIKIACWKFIHAAVQNYDQNLE